MFIVRWDKEPSADDVEGLVQEIKVQFEKTKTQLHYVAMVSEGTPVPSPQGRANLKQLISRALPYIKRVRMVLEGDGIKAMFQRTVHDGVWMLQRAVPRGVVSTHRTAGEAVGISAAEIGVPAESFLIVARRAGLLLA